MTRLEELTLKLADDALNDSETRELEGLLAATRAAADSHTQLLELEAALRGQRETLDLAGPTLTRLRTEVGLSIERGVMQRLESEPPPAWAHSRAATPSFEALPNATQQRSRRREEADQAPFSHLRSASLPRRLRPPWNSHVVLAFAASVVLLLSLSVWFFSPTMGQPVLAEVKGVDASIERGTEFVPAAKGMVLQPADVLRLGTNATVKINFGKEKTRLELGAGTELKLASLTRGKRFALQEGRIEASVARQRPLHAMIITTPQAEARVLGTKFTLTATTNATRLEVTEGKVKLTRTSDDAAVKVPGGYYAIAATNAELAALPATGRILREVWTNYPGDFMALMTSDATISDHPDGSEYLTSFETPSKRGVRFGQRVRGYLHPSITGEYRFSIAVIKSGEAYLLLSPDDKPANRVQIVFDYTRPPLARPDPPGGVWSAPITLVAGRKYYIETLHESDAGDGHFTVRWQGSGREREVIAGEFLSPVKSPTKERR